MLSGGDGHATPTGSTFNVTGKLRGTELTLDAGGLTITGTVTADRIDGHGWSATRVTP